MTQAVELLVLSLVLGFLQIMVGMGCKFYVQWRSGDRWGAVFDTGFWMTGLAGIGLWLAGGMLTPVLATVGMWTAILSALGLVLTAGRAKKGPMRFVSGLASLYDSTSYVSDLMSYSRLMALGLTTGAMASVFNKLGTIMGGGVGGVILMLIIFPSGTPFPSASTLWGRMSIPSGSNTWSSFPSSMEAAAGRFRPFALRSHYIRIKEETKQ